MLTFCVYSSLQPLRAASSEQKGLGYSVSSAISDKLGNNTAYLSPRNPQLPLCKATEYCFRPPVHSPRGSSDCMQQKLCGISTTSPPLSVLLEDPPELLVASVCSAAHGRCPTGEASGHPQGPVDTPAGVSLVPLRSWYSWYPGLVPPGDGQG
ncbi:hypothetical protein BDP81DRAFT_136435 [Colletotrichum phormii]|uniref:Uncharacterized protein n=1 Tax=Colletotrichum phormii TaxID=359342 RepID=A0AAI9ZH19_9PEZI|nr:uncharacterized protein BDP81DRAFT_136435 [Colletotrichum phormii]KAK1623214.1 hypothetical protein BDP81DRAFT_136435 [Colletotrichum phormii]